MQPNTVKRTLKEGGTAIGTMVFEFCTPGVARLSAEAGAEFIMYDMEHTGWSVETVRDLIATTNADHIEPLVRVPATQYHFIARVLDVGARGVMVPVSASGCTSSTHGARIAARPPSAPERVLPPDSG